jgi:hypothetical protein
MPLSRYFGSERPNIPPLVVLGKRGLAGEIANLRSDVESGFYKAQQDIDALLAHFDPQWNDLQGAVSQGQANLALAQDTYQDTQARYLFFSHNTADELTFRYQMSHTWVVGTDVRPHIHFIPMSAPVSPQVAVFTGYYAWTQPNSDLVLPALSGWTTFRLEREISAADQYKERIVGLDLITPPPEANDSAHLHVFWKNATSDGAYTYKTNKDHGVGTANILLLSFDTHIQNDDLGSVQEFPGAP